MPTLTDPPTAPLRTMTQTAFDAAMAAEIAWRATNITELRAFLASLTTLAAGGFAIPYTFGSATGDTDPTAGILCLNNATQNLATVIRVDLVDADGRTRTPTLDTFDDSTNTIKGHILVEGVQDPTDWLLFSVTALASPSGYKNITAAVVDFSAANPFTAGDAVVLKFSRAGDMGATGATGAAGAAGSPAGYTATSTGTTVTLTSASNGYQKITPTAWDVAVVLPDATTMTVGYKFVIENAGLYPMPIQSNGGLLIGWCMPGQMVHIWLRVATPAAGQWKITSGDISSDAGLNWWGSAAGGGVSVANPARITTCAVSSKFGVVGFWSGTHYLLRGYSIFPFALGAAATLLASSELGDEDCIDVVALSSTRLFFIYQNASGANTYVRTVDLLATGTTLALTLNTQLEIDTSASVTGGISCSMKDASTVLITFQDAGSVFTCETISIDGAGTCTENASATVASAISVSNASCKVLSSTLAHVQYWNGTTTYVNRIVLAGTGVTPGTPVTVTSRQMFLDTGGCDLGKASATESWSILTTDNAGSYGSGDIYGEVYTDTGSTITITQTALKVQTSTQNTTSRINPRMFSASDTSGCGQITYMSDANNIFSFGMAHVSGTAVVLSGDLQQPANIAGASDSSTSEEATLAGFLRMRTYNGIGLFAAGKPGTTAMCLHPIALA